MGTVSKITGTLATSIAKVSGVAISGISNIMGHVVSLFSNSAQSISLDGTNDYVTMGNDSSIKPTAAITYNIWMKRDDWTTFNGGSQMIMTCGPGQGIYTRWKSRKVQAFVYVNSAWYFIQTLTNKFRSGYNYGTGIDGWHMMSVTWDGRYWKLYINAGIDGLAGTSGTNDIITMDLVPAGGASITYGTDSEMQLSKSDYQDASYNDTHLDEAAVWDVALTEANLIAIYNAGVSANLNVDSGNYDKSGDLQGWWRFEELSGTSIADSSTNSNTATLMNGTAFSTDVPD